MNIEAFTSQDLHFLTELQPEGWSDISPYFKFYLSSPLCYPIKIEIDYKVVAIGCCIIHDDVAWFGHIIVHPAYRNRGLGKMITENLIKISENNNCSTVYLIATDLGEPVYQKVGFEVETEYIVYEGVKIDEDIDSSEFIIPYQDDFIDAIKAMDFNVSGENRFYHLKEYLGSALIYQKSGKIVGYYLPNWQEGLIIANDKDAGIAFMKMKLKRDGKISFPKENLIAQQFLSGLDIVKTKFIKRMRLGEERFWQPKFIYGRIGGNLG